MKLKKFEEEITQLNSLISHFKSDAKALKIENSQMKNYYENIIESFDLKNNNNNEKLINKVKKKRIFEEEEEENIDEIKKKKELLLFQLEDQKKKTDYLLNEIDYLKKENKEKNIKNKELFVDENIKKKENENKELKEQNLKLCYDLDKFKDREQNLTVEIEIMKENFENELQGMAKTIQNERNIYEHQLISLKNSMIELETKLENYSSSAINDDQFTDLVNTNRNLSMVLSNKSIEIENLKQFYFENKSVLNIFLYIFNKFFLYIKIFSLKN